MTLSRRIVVALMLLLCTPSHLAHADEQSEISSISEIILPEFQATAIKQDGAVVDTLLAGDVLWIATKKILWKWNFLERKVQKITLIQRNEPDHLLDLGFDGLNLYVAFTSGVYQFAIKQAKVYKYRFGQAQNIKKAEFFGQGDDFWLVSNDQLSRIDRYGKTISPVKKLPVNASLSAVSFDPATSMFWYISKNTLYRYATLANQEPVKVLQLKQPVQSLVAKNGGAIVTTTKTVLITDSEGKRLQTIPVEKSRQIVAVSNSDTQHAYIFNDQVLESFDLATQSVGRYMLPLDAGQKIKKLKVGSNLAHMVVDGQVRLFVFAPAAKTPK